MQKRRAKLPDGVPAAILALAGDAPVYNSSSSLAAQVYFIDRGRGLYLKTAQSGTLAREAEMTAYFHSCGIGVQVLDYVTDGTDWLLTAAAQGEDATHPDSLAEPYRLAAFLGTSLRCLHEMPHDGCPVQGRLLEYFTLVEKNAGEGRYDPSFLGDASPILNADEALCLARKGKAAMTGEVLLHGDYCLPNIILDGWRLSAFIDVGNGGVGDRHIDLFWGLWSLWYNLKTNAYSQVFLDAYGRDKVKTDLLLAVAAAECFG